MQLVFAAHVHPAGHHSPKKMIPYNERHSFGLFTHNTVSNYTFNWSLNLKVIKLKLYQKKKKNQINV